MAKEEKEPTEVQGTEVDNMEKRKVQMSIKELLELTENEELRKTWLIVLRGDKEIKAPQGIKIAKAMIRQLKLL